MKRPNIVRINCKRKCCMKYILPFLFKYSLLLNAIPVVVMPSMKLCIIGGKLKIRAMMSKVKNAEHIGQKIKFWTILLS